MRQEEKNHALRFNAQSSSLQTSSTSQAERHAKSEACAGQTSRTESGGTEVICLQSAAIAKTILTALEKGRDNTNYVQD